MPQVDATSFEQFQRAGIGLSAVFGSASMLTGLQAFVARVVNQETDPRLVPHSALEAMGTHPVVYLAERMVSGVVRRPDLYSVEHEDPRIKAETEEWLWPLLPRILSSLARAYAYGSSVVIFNWGRETIRIKVPRSSGEGMRSRRIVDHTHYTRAAEVRRSEVAIETDGGDELVEVNYAGTTYPAERAYLLLWDDEYGNLTGQGARRRAWRDYCVDLILEQLECGYLERSVDSPRVAQAPSGKIEDEDGNQVDIAAFVNSLLMSLRGGGAVTFPQQYDANGKPLYTLTTLNLPDREKVWQMAIQRREARIMIAYLGMVGTDTSGASKTLDGLLKEFVQDIATWCAESITKMVETVHAANHDPERVAPPELKATDVGKTAAKRILAEVLKAVGGGELGRWVDVSKALDRLGVPILDAEREPRESAAPPGRPRDLAGDREERREDADTEPGEDDTGGEDPERDEQGPNEEG